MQGGLITRKLSLRPSGTLAVRPSVKRVYYDKTEERSVQIFYTIRKIISFSLVFFLRNSWWGDPIYLKIWVKIDPVGAKTPIFSRFALAPQQ